ncbi:hypothetical protein ACFWBX_27940 [Streptomyces sp. NPDC059991]|uniref:hypothetical protein n=1 Tax=Streptomyces sp. NPDC059991 TaxID=3347028 RepID=UPI0036A99E7C
MFKPKYPTPDTYTTITTALAPTTQHYPDQTYTPAPMAPAPARPTVQLTPGALIALVGGGTAVVLVVGVVLVSLLLAVAITGASVAVCAVVLRSLLTTSGKVGR